MRWVGRALSPQHPPTASWPLLKTWCKAELQGSLDCMEGQTNVQLNRKDREEKASFLTASYLDYSSSLPKRTSLVQSLSQVTQGSLAGTALFGWGQLLAVLIRPAMAHLQAPSEPVLLPRTADRVSYPVPELASRPPATPQLLSLCSHLTLCCKWQWVAHRILFSFLSQIKVLYLS